MTAILVLGSNFGKREAAIRKALDCLSEVCSLLKMSDIYESPDYFGSFRKYANLVVEIETEKEELLINNIVKKIEKTLGRTKESRERGEVIIDIDIVIWNNEIRRHADYNSTYFKKGYLQLKKQEVLGLIQ